MVGRLVLTEVGLSDGRGQRRSEAQFGFPSRWEPHRAGSTRLLPRLNPSECGGGNDCACGSSPPASRKYPLNPDALPPTPDPRMILARYASTPPPPGPVVRRQFYWINKWRYARHVGRNACRAGHPGEYVGQGTRVEYVVTRNGKGWVYVFDRPHKRPVTIRPEPNRHSRRVQQAVAFAMNGSATDFTVTYGSCPDAQPGTRESLVSLKAERDQLVEQLKRRLSDPGDAGVPPEVFVRNRPRLPCHSAAEAGIRPQSSIGVPLAGGRRVTRGEAATRAECPVRMRPACRADA